MDRVDQQAEDRMPMWRRTLTMEHHWLFDVWLTKKANRMPVTSEQATMFLWIVFESSLWLFKELINLNILSRRSKKNKLKCFRH